MISMKQPTGRPDYNWEEFATEESFQKMKDERDAKLKHGEKILVKRAIIQELLLPL